MSQEIVQSLQEMFPNHSRDTIQLVVHETNGNLDAAINRLLNMKNKSSSQQPASRPPPQNSQPSQEHIFPEDFLRWPKNVEWICVNSDLSDYTLQTDDDVTYNQSSDSMDPLPENASLQRSEIDSNSQLSGWAKLKSRFMSMGSGYNQI